MTVVAGKYRGSKEYQTVYSLLVEAARCRRTVTYKEIAGIMGLLPSGNYMGVETGHLVGEISEDEHRNGRPMLSALVVHSTDGMPGKGLYTLARGLGKLQEATRDGELRFWETEKAAVYAAWQRRLG